MAPSRTLDRNIMAKKDTDYKLSVNNIIDIAYTDLDLICLLQIESMVLILVRRPERFDDAKPVSRPRMNLIAGADILGAR